MRCFHFDLPLRVIAKRRSAGRSNRRSWRRREAFTLLEVIVALVLMASVLVGSLLSFSAHQRQLAAADKRVAAIAVADDLLSQLTGDSRRLPYPLREVIPGYPNWFWQTSVVGTTSPLGIPMRVIRLSVIEFRPQDGVLQTLASVDLVEPV